MTFQTLARSQAFLLRTYSMPRTCSWHLGETIMNKVEKAPVLLDLTFGGETDNKEVDTNLDK